MGRAEGSEGLSTLPKMTQLENGRTQNQLLIGLAQKSGLLLQDSGQGEGAQVNGKPQVLLEGHAPTLNASLVPLLLLFC